MSIERKFVEEKLVAFGFEGKPYDDRSAKENGILYRKDSNNDLNVILNGVELYVPKGKYLTFEVDDYSIVIRLYFEHHYISCIVENWEDINSFDLRKGI